MEAGQGWADRIVAPRQCCLPEHSAPTHSVQGEPWEGMPGAVPAYFIPTRPVLLLKSLSNNCVPESSMHPMPGLGNRQA